MSRITVLGAGAWGTAIALTLATRPDHEVWLWAHTPEHAAALGAERENRRYLPGFALHPALRVSGSLAQAVEGAEAVILVVPSEHMRATASALSLHTGAFLLSASKGIEDRTLCRMTEVLAEACPGSRVGALSGPSFAQEVAAGAPSAATVAFARSEDAEHAQRLLTTETFRLYRNTDVIGVELGGALKNVMAIAAGAVAGLGLGHNSAAALITRGIAEMTRLALACGGRRETLAGLAGGGGVILTCTGGRSRPRPGWSWDVGGAYRRSWPGWAAKWPRASARPMPRSRSPPGTGSRCRSRRRYMRCCTAR